jgi:hypothetical protein
MRVEPDWGYYLIGVNLVAVRKYAMAGSHGIMFHRDSLHPKAIRIEGDLVILAAE